MNSENQPGLFPDPDLPRHVVQPLPRRPEPSPRVQCRANACTAAVKPEHLMCAKHWALVPKPVRAAVWKHYAPGQTFETATTSYLLAAAAAVEEVARAEGRDAANVFRSLAKERARG